jgi:hypothetical protein
MHKGGQRLMSLTMERTQPFCSHYKCCASSARCVYHCTSSTSRCSGSASTLRICSGPSWSTTHHSSKVCKIRPTCCFLLCVGNLTLTNALVNLSSYGSRWQEHAWRLDSVGSCQLSTIVCASNAAYCDVILSDGASKMSIYESCKE